MCAQIRYTPLHCAVDGRQAGAVVALLLRGASVTAKDYVRCHMSAAPQPNIMHLKRQTACVNHVETD